MEHTIALDPELESFIQTQVRSGRYGSVEEAIRSGVRLLEQQALAEALRASLEQARRGEFIDADTVFVELERQIAAGIPIDLG